MMLSFWSKNWAVLLSYLTSILKKTAFGVKMLGYTVACQIVICLTWQLRHGVGANTFTQFKGTGVPGNLDQFDQSVSCINRFVFFSVFICKLKHFVSQVVFENILCCIKT